MSRKNVLLRRTNIKKNNTRVCDEYLFGQVSTCTCHYQLQIFRCTMCTLEDTHARLFSGAILDDVMSQNEPTTKLLRRSKKEWRLKTIRGTEFNIKKSNAT